MKKMLAATCLIFAAIASSSQTSLQGPKLSPAAMHEDLAFLRNQLFSVHADPFTEITKDQYQAFFNRIDGYIKDSLTIFQFYQLIKPAVSNLSDEHAEISLPKKFDTYEGRPVFIPFSLIRSGGKYLVDTVLSKNSSLKKGDIIKQVNGVAIENIVEKIASYTTGYPGQRQEKALVQFGYLYTLSSPASTEFRITTSSRTIILTGVSYFTWYDHLVAIYGGGRNCEQLLSYRKIGDTGYIDACSFGARGDSAFKAYAKTADSLFNLAKQDRVKQVIIDVSKNSGGNSALGNFLIRQFYSGGYINYQMNWRRSEEYLKQIRNWGLSNPPYEKLQPGDVMHSGPDSAWIDGVSDLYKGKVYILIGNGTFSSAIMFATIIKDNKLATLIGEEPKNGHPTHFGEIYGVTLPNSQLALRFGVKEWIRPLGKEAGNILDPDIKISAEGSPEEIAKRLTGR